MAENGRNERGRHHEEQKDNNRDGSHDPPAKSTKPGGREDSQRESREKEEASDQPERQSFPTGRRLVVINNGDKLSRGRPVQLNEKKAKTWEGVLADISDKVRPTFGAVKRVFTPTNGTEVKDMAQLEPNGVYVIAGTDKFQTIPNGYDKSIIVPVNPRQNRMSISSKTAPPPKEPVAPQFSGEEVQDSQRGSVQLVIIHLCTLDGKLIEHVADLKTNGYYVAVGPYEKFRHVEYTLEGRPNMVVPIKRSGKNPYEVKEAEQPGAERKRRRTFVVRLKKNSSMTDDEEEREEDSEGRHTRHHRSTDRRQRRSESPERHHRKADSPDQDRHHRRSHSPTSHERDAHTERESHHNRHHDRHEYDEKKRHHSKESRHRHHRDDDVIEVPDPAQQGLYAQGRAELNKSAHSVMLREAINKSHSQLVVGSAKSRHDHDGATLGPSRSQSLPGGPSQKNLGEPKSKLGLTAGSTAVLTPGSTANLTPGSTLNMNGTSTTTLQPSTSKLSVHSHKSHKSRAGSRSRLDLEEEDGTSKADLGRSQHSRLFDTHSKLHHSDREGAEEDDDDVNHHISHRLIPSYIDEQGEPHDAQEIEGHSGRTGALGDHFEGEVPDHSAAGKSHRHDELHSHVTTVGPDGELIHTERHDITEHDEDKKPKKKKGGCC
ncbi:hypothetical protein RvY_10128 [Ramazzottius varieornatus]|uniref:Doublecortin domain-containing protein n=1 Tax=Ramazzottius varieornatus TaxID=947166 RepID=A0A1D1VJJ1_RAMVA|nr:hypothetical protein RvY_10128 [Ramazzottius varieornatus]